MPAFKKSAFSVDTRPRGNTQDQQRLSPRAGPQEASRELRSPEVLPTALLAAQGTSFCVLQLGVGLLTDLVASHWAPAEARPQPQ